MPLDHRKKISLFDKYFDNLIGDYLLVELFCAVKDNSMLKRNFSLPINFLL